MNINAIKEDSYKFLSKAYDVSGPNMPPLTFNVFRIGMELGFNGPQINDIVRELAVQGFIEPFMGSSTRVLCLKHTIFKHR